MYQYLVPLILAAAGGVGVFFSAIANARADVDATRPDPPEPIETPSGLDHVRELFERMVSEFGAPAEILPLVLWQAMTESGGNPLVGLGEPDHPGWPEFARPNMKASASLQRAETRAAERGHDRNIEWASKSPAPASHWRFGSGGLFGFLPATALYPLRNKAILSSGEVRPHDVFDSYRAVAFYVDYIRRVMRLPHFRNLPRQHQNMLAIKRAGAALTFVKDYAEEKERSQSIRRKMERAASRLGVSESVFERPLDVDWSAWDLSRTIQGE